MLWRPRKEHEARACPFLCQMQLFHPAAACCLLLVSYTPLAWLGFIAAPYGRLLLTARSESCFVLALTPTHFCAAAAGTQVPLAPLSCLCSRAAIASAAIKNEGRRPSSPERRRDHPQRTLDQSLVPRVQHGHRRRRRGWFCWRFRTSTSHLLRRTSARLGPPSGEDYGSRGRGVDARRLLCFAATLALATHPLSLVTYVYMRLEGNLLRCVQRALFLQLVALTLGARVIMLAARATLHPAAANNKHRDKALRCGALLQPHLRTAARAALARRRRPTKTALSHNSAARRRRATATNHG